MLKAYILRDTNITKKEASIAEPNSYGDVESVTTQINTERFLRASKEKVLQLLQQPEGYRGMKNYQSC